MQHQDKRLPPPATAHPSSSFLSSSSSKDRLHFSLSFLSHRPSPLRVRRVTILVVFILVLFVVIASLSTQPSTVLHWHRPPFTDLRRLSRRTLRLYQRQLHLHPLSSRAITAGIIFFIADLSAQVLNRPPGKWLIDAFSVPRLFRYSVYGLFFMGPFLYIWYELMNQYGPDDDFKGSLLKCLFEQITLEPVCISMYIIYDGAVCRRGLRQTRQKLTTQFLPLLFKNAIFWLPANFANYYIGTPDLRVVFANLCSLFWNIYFSAKVNKVSASSFALKADSYIPLSNHERTLSPFRKESGLKRTSDIGLRPQTSSSTHVV